VNSGFTLSQWEDGFQILDNGTWDANITLTNGHTVRLSDILEHQFPNEVKLPVFGGEWGLEGFALAPVEVGGHKKWARSGGGVDVFGGAPTVSCLSCIHFSLMGTAVLPLLRRREPTSSRETMSACLWSPRFRCVRWHRMLFTTRSSDKPSMCHANNEIHKTIGGRGPDCGCSPTLWALLPQWGSTCPHEVHDARCMIHDVIQPAVLHPVDQATPPHRDTQPRSPCSVLHRCARSDLTPYQVMARARSCNVHALLLPCYCHGIYMFLLGLTMFLPCSCRALTSAWSEHVKGMARAWQGHGQSTPPHAMFLPCLGKCTAGASWQ
jgi:hypothetical protein